MFNDKRRRRGVSRFVGIDMLGDGMTVLHPDDPAYLPARPAPKHSWVMFENRLSDGTPRTHSAESTSLGLPRDSAGWIGDPRFDSMSVPRRLLRGYEERRDDSPLGHVFTTANAMHDWIDALVVIGRPETTVMTRALIDALVEPHRNEMSRARRGSKPRIYFIEPSPDDESAASLQNHLAQTCGHAMGRAAMLEIIEPDQTSLERGVADHWRQFIDRQPGRGDMPNDVTLDLRIETDNGSTHPLGVATLLPCAMVAIDCVKLIDGAMRISDGLIVGNPPSDLLVGLLEIPVRHYRSALHCLKPLGRILSMDPSTTPNIDVTCRRIRTDRVYDALPGTRERSVTNDPPGASGASHAAAVRLPHIDSFTLGQWIGAEHIARLIATADSPTT